MTHATKMEDLAHDREAARARRAQHRQTRCVMLLPADLAGKRVLDIGCRKGLGAFKIADRVGPSGFVVGVDAVQDHLDIACDRASEQHWAHDDWERYLRFVRADGCELQTAGIEEASFDVVVVNSVLNLEPDLTHALGEIARVLVPGGLLYHDAVLANEEPPLPVAQACRAEHNVFGCAPTWAAFEESLGLAGFASWMLEDEMPVEIPAGDERADLAAYTFASAVVQARR